MSLNEQQLAQLMAATAQQHTETPLIEFKAGFLEMKGSTVTADPRRGRIVIFNEDGMLKFQHKLRAPNDTVLSQVFIYPGQATWKRVNECKDGRVYLLKLNDSTVKRFFWMQDGDEKKDEEVNKKLSDLFARGAPAAAAAGAGAGAGALGAALAGLTGRGAAAASGAGARQARSAAAPMITEEDDLARAIRESLLAIQPQTTSNSSSSASSSSSTSSSTPLLDQTAVREVRQGDSVGVTPNPHASESTAPHGAAGLPPASTSSSSSSSSAPSSSSSSVGTDLLSRLQFLATQMAQQNELISSRPTLNDVLDNDKVMKIMNDDQTIINALISYLPEGKNNEEELKNTLKSPQYQSTLSRITSILNSPNFGQLLASLNLNPQHAKDIGVEGFLQAIQKQVENDKNKSSSSSSSTDASKDDKKESK